ncbi:peptidoglycan-recognition protein LA [Scaptodrosophila lebanonensis]|uniref:Peptidoglycan-recognition protein LA n=1 Tax=Drosophila lebanonensis TaxID=7225 RepID=A0A6J2T6P4_DROLE|nr:peptidoglycan-recognition protein LA [Scaptodrosophila lebanonensis]
MYEQNSTESNPFTNAAEAALWTLQGRQGSGPANSSARLANASPAAIPQNIFTNPAIQPSSVINLSNSTDVVIGPMTQYQGPVTIYQYMDATVEARSVQAGAGITSSRSSNTTNVKQRLTRNSLLLITLIVLVVVTASVILYVELSRHRGARAEGDRPIYFGNNYDHDTFPNLGNGHLIIDRDQWGASERARPLTVPLRKPIPYVLITHIGVQSIPCVNVYKCSIKMRTIQDSAIAEKNLPDIQSNFYVSDEGNVYVGRGWDWANTYANDTLAITFMGDYGRYEPSKKQLEGVQFLLAHAVANKQLDVGYKLVAHNQTRPSKSPGANVYREISKWPHFYLCGTENTPKCGIELGMSPSSWDSKM